MGRMARNLQSFTEQEQSIIRKIILITNRNNIDNISRTDAYFKYYQRHPEIQWAFLASMVSRNAGWNICDLEGIWFPELLPKNKRNLLFLTYERANWLIFQDAFPQLLLYHYSTKLNRSMFHLLKIFKVSLFMEKEWFEFFQSGNKQRLMISLIINEQNVIQKPVIEHPLFNKKVFHSFVFSFQDWFHFSSVLFPTCDGEIYGASVNGFRSVTKRIDLGKRLADILFLDELYPRFYQFAKNTVHTGSRMDYEQYLNKHIFRSNPFLRTTFPIINHFNLQKNDWSENKRINRKWKSQKVNHIHPIQLTYWFAQKQNQLKKTVLLKKLLE